MTDSTEKGPIGHLVRESKTVLLRLLRFAAYEARSRNATVEGGLPASITYVTEEATNGEAVA